VTYSVYTGLFIMSTQSAFLSFSVSSSVQVSSQGVCSVNSPTAALSVNLLIARISFALLDRGYLTAFWTVSSQYRQPTWPDASVPNAS
jgi:hypothetical protein